MNDLNKSNMNQLLSMDAMTFSFKTIKVFCISDPDEQMAFEEAYNQKTSIVTILKDFFDNEGRYYLSVEIREIRQEEEGADEEKVVVQDGDE